MKTFEDSPEAVDVLNEAIKGLVYTIGDRVFYAGICIAIGKAWHAYCITRGVACAHTPAAVKMFPDTFQIIEELLVSSPNRKGRLLWDLDKEGYQKRLSLLTSICANRTWLMDTYVKVAFHADYIRVSYVGQDTLFYGARTDGV
jgi:hypothetical protein